MKKSILLLFVIALSGTSAIARCKVAVGGPGVNEKALTTLSSSIESMFQGHKNLRVDTHPVSSLPEAVASDADFIVYLKGDASNIVVQFRDILLGTVMSEGGYSFLLSFNGAVKEITDDISNEIVPLLPSYCKK